MFYSYYLNYILGMAFAIFSLLLPQFNSMKTFLKFLLRLLVLRQKMQGSILLPLTWHSSSYLQMQSMMIQLIRLNSVTIFTREKKLPTGSFGKKWNTITNMKIQNLMMGIFLATQPSHCITTHNLSSGVKNRRK